MKISRIPFAILILTFLTAVLVSAQESREVNKSASFGANGRVYVDTYKGTIHFLPWDKPEIEIHAVIESDGRDRDSREQVRDTEIRIDLSESSAHIKTDYDAARRRHHGFFGLFTDDSNNLPSVYYTIKIPRTTKVVVKDYKSKTTIDDLQADVDLETYKGEVAIGRLTGALALQTYKGEAKIEFANISGRSRVETYKGEIEVRVPRGKGFDLETDMGRHARLNSDVEIVRDRNDRQRGYEARTSVNGGGPTLYVKTDRGTIRLYEH